MPYNPTTHRRRSTRLPYYDYALPGYYFVTICTHRRLHLFGKIQDGSMILNSAGCAAQAYWYRLAQYFTHIQLDAFVVMPNHVHGVIEIVELPNKSDGNASDRSSPTSGRGEAWSPETSWTNPKRCSDHASPLRSVEPPTDRPHGTPSGSIGAIVGNYKSVSARRINCIRRSPGTAVWQRNYHDRIIRSNVELNNVRAYIEANPQNWERDRLRLPK